LVRICGNGVETRVSIISITNLFSERVFVLVIGKALFE
jgi:hypothetical protein